jgi:hypothetical protein
MRVSKCSSLAWSNRGWFVAQALQVPFGDLAEGTEVQALVQLGEKDVAVVAQEAVYLLHAAVEAVEEAVLTNQPW